MTLEKATIKYKDFFWSKVEKPDYTDCWFWNGYITPKGYGRYAIYGQTAFYAHRFALVSSGVAIPKSKVVDHICKNRSCVNPKHLRLVSIRQNTLENSESNPAKNLRKTHCIRGHKLILKYKSGRRCKECMIAAQKKRKRIVNGKIYPVSARAEGKDADSFFVKLIK